MIPQDKLIHFLGCYLVCSMLISLIGLLGAITITALLGMAKEVVYDWWMKKGTPEIYDFVADALGIILACLVWRI